MHTTKEVSPYESGVRRRLHRWSEDLFPGQPERRPRTHVQPAFGSQPARATQPYRHSRTSSNFNCRRTQRPSAGHSTVLAPHAPAPPA